ncbi:hypothetical protein [Planobispora longispora]|uniref:hypothetical protein n=1 Tax=Planobispora longispora TaxID=28887 RepID=UPI0036112626
MTSSVGASAEAVTVSSEDCPEPARTADGFQAASVPSGWELLAAGERGALRGGVVTADGALWALREEGQGDLTLRRWKDGRWEAVAGPPGMKPGALAASPGGGIWVAQPGEGMWSDTGTWKVGVREGGGWRTLALDVPDQKAGGGSADAHGGWMTFSTVAVHWDGANWKRMNLPAGQEDVGGFSDVDAYRLSGSAEEIWAVPLTGATAVRLRDGVSQTVQFTLRIDAKEAIHDTQGGLFYPQAVAVVGADDRWLLGTAAFGTHYLDENEDTVAGRLVAVRHTRGEWTCTWGPFHREQFDGAFVDAVPDGDGGLWAATAHGTLWHLGDGRWTRQRLPADEGAEPNVNDLVVGGDQIYALGWVASQGRFHGALWRAG